ncbi:MAG: methyltransferase domain-containing protein [Coleofasciculus sp. D1-CHI-01]|uniref:class I SAM-dependent methyltransferase n=1 Tax=Coleofasciculus sp. D1-CHI-01 TaxID=3068482 RepID=UPI0032F3C6A1
MPGISAILFVARNLDKAEIRGKRIIDVGSYDFNGSIRPLIESWEPAEYIGVDILNGSSVDVVCNADDLVDKFGKESFDVVLSLEMLEHSRNWKRSISNIKNICKPNGIILITTRSYGHPCHGFPHDFWRYEFEDMKYIFSDFESILIEKDYQSPGVFLKAKKNIFFIEKELSDYCLYSILFNKKLSKINKQDYKTFYFRRLAMKQHIKKIGNKLIFNSGKAVTRFLNI